MPITMMFAARHIGEKYGRYALDHRVMAEAQLRTAAGFGFDHVSGITETREAQDCGRESSSSKISRGPWMKATLCSR